MSREHPRTRSLLLGVIVEDAGDAIDLDSTLSRNGMDVVELLGLPAWDEEPVDADAIVVALETGTAPVARAVADAVEAGRWLLDRGARQLLFGYSPVLASNEAGNIGPVAEALLDLVGEDLTVACPACPESGHTVYQGHLFVGDRPVSETGMGHQPLKPVTDADLVRFLGTQCRRPGSVGLVPFDIVDRGAGAIRASIADLRARGVRLAVMDAVKEDHLWSAATAGAQLRLLTGGSGIARGLPANFRRTDVLPQRVEPELRDLAGPVAVLAGSGAEATRVQRAAMAGRYPTLALDAPLNLGEIVAEARGALERGAVLIHPASLPDEVEKPRRPAGDDKAGVIEDAWGEIASALVAIGVRTFVVAGAGTARRVAAALGLRRLRIGPEIEPGVPWTVHLGEPPVHVAFKPDDVGSEELFLKAIEALAR